MNYNFVTLNNDYSFLSLLFFRIKNSSTILLILMFCVNVCSVLKMVKPFSASAPLCSIFVKVIKGIFHSSQIMSFFSISKKVLFYCYANCPTLSMDPHPPRHRGPVRRGNAGALSPPLSKILV